MKKNLHLLFILLLVFQVAVKAQDRIYWGIPSSNISSAKLDGTDVKLSVALSSQTFDMETDFYKGILYWGDDRLVKKAKTDGTNPQILYTNSRAIGGLALDLINNKLYFSDYGSGNVIIRRCNLDGTGTEVIVTSPNSNLETYNLTISTTLQKLYWTESTSSNTNSIIMRCNLDGTNVETVKTTTNFIPGLTIDEKNQKLYLAYWSENKVMTTDMTCSTAPTLVFGSSQGTFQMAVSNVDDKLYFGEMRSKKIRKCNLDGSLPQDIVSGLSGQPMALSIPTVPPAPTIYANETYTFKLNDFLFSSVDKDLLTKIKITTLTSKGTLYLDANNNNIVDAGEAVGLNQEIAKADLVAGTLKFNPVVNDYGSPYTTFTFRWFDGTSYSTLDYLQYIYVLSVAPTVTTEAVSGIGSTTATGNGNITNLGVPFPTSYGICWNTTGSPTTSDNKVDNGTVSTTGTFTAAMTGLTASTTYKARAYATNEAGTSYGAEVSFTTTNDLVAPTATTNVATSITSAGTTLNGSINANNASTTVTFEYGLTTNYGTTVTADESPVTGSSATTVSYSLSGLTAGTTYHYRVVGANASGTTNGDDMTFTTLKLSSVTTQAVSSISTNSVVANGNITDLGQPNPTAYGFCWSTSPNPTTDNSKLNKGSISNTGAFSATLTGLVTYTQYYVRAYSINEAGTSYGEEVSFNTKGIIANVILYEIKDIESTSAIGKCSITDLGFPNATAYGICWSTSPNPTMFNSKINNLGSPTTIGAFYASLTELEPNTVYYARVYAANTEGIAYSDEISFKTTQSYPVITWNNPSDISYGTALNDLQLNATSNVEGTFEYTPAAGTKLNVGDAQELNVTFTPSDLTKNNIVSKTVLINIRKAIPLIIWENPQDIKSGTALSNLQLNAVANVEGTFVYDPAVGTILNTGNLQELTVLFSPTDKEHYTVTGDTVKINVVINTGIDTKKQSSIKIYPNPTTDKFYISGIEDQTTVRILSLNGELISEKKIANKEAISIQNLPAGTYLIDITNKEAMTYYKLVKK